jgi:hypothetical protein
VKLVPELLACLDKPKTEAVVRRYVAELTEKTLDEWDDAARWRMLVTRFGGEMIQEAVTMAALRALNDLLASEE